MPLLGAHMSIAGGYEKAVEAAAACEMDVVQIFTKNNNQWRAKPITDDDVAAFQTVLSQRKIRHPIAHASYLINLAAPDPELWKKSIDSMIVELQRAERLGLANVVVHPGAYTSSSEEAGIRRIAAALDEVHRQLPGGHTACLLENTAGQGSTLGWRFEQLASILDQVADPDRLGICFDTCHAFAAGYGLSQQAEYRKTMRALQQTVGRQLVYAVHLNDSKRPLGSRVDRHAHIGHGHIGLEGFRRLLRDRHFRPVPMYLETPKEPHPETGEPWDVVNLRTLRTLARTPSASPS